MRGTPVWLASLSRGSRVIRGPSSLRSSLGRSGRSGAPQTQGRLSTQVWTKQTMDESIALLRRIIGPAGNPERERVFRMQITLCIHRACTPEEVAALPEYFHTDPATDLAGGPVEIVYETESSGPSTWPCEQPTRYPLDPHNSLLWFPIDCGKCTPCRARQKLDADMGQKAADLPKYLNETLGRLPV